MSQSFAQSVFQARRPVILFHTWTATKELLARAIREKRSMDLDVCVDNRGNPYLGHPAEYHEKTHEPLFNSMPLWDAVEALAASEIPVIVDCKHFDAWPAVREVVQRLRPERCLVHCFVSELKFNAGRVPGEPDFLSEWCSIEHLQSLKREFPALTTTASAKWLAADTLVAQEHEPLLDGIVKLLTNYAVDTVCLNVPNETFSNAALRRFLQNGILPHVGIDAIDPAKLSELYIGETDRLDSATQGCCYGFVRHGHSSKIVS